MKNLKDHVRVDKMRQILSENMKDDFGSDEAISQRW